MALLVLCEQNRVSNQFAAKRRLDTQMNVIDWSSFCQMVCKTKPGDVYHPSPMNITLCDKLNDDIMHRLFKDLSCQRLVGLNGRQSRPQRVPKIQFQVCSKRVTPRRLGESIRSYTKLLLFPILIL